MATEFPQEQVDPQAGPEDEQGMVFDLDLDEPYAEVEEQPDGSAIVRMEEFKGPKEDQDFYANLADDLHSWDLDKIALR